LSVNILIGDCRERLRELPDASVHCCVTSPPYFGLRDYGVDGQMGLEPTPDDFVAGMVEVFREVRRVLRDDGTLWLNLGDSYARNPSKGVRFAGKNGAVNDRQTVEGNRGPPIAPGFKEKDRLMIPARTALALQADGWWLRDEIIWHKPRTTPHPVMDRTVSAHEMIYLLAKSKRYYFDYLAIEEPSQYAGETRQKSKVFRRLTEARLNTKNSGQTFAAERDFTVRDTRRKRSVWSVNPSPYKDAHFATYPPDLIEPCILAGCPKGGTVLDPFGGAGTTGLVCERLQRDAVIIELNPEYAAIAEKRMRSECSLLAQVRVA
jgi:DNA modification methylase